MLQTLFLNLKIILIYFWKIKSILKYISSVPVPCITCLNQMQTKKSIQTIKTEMLLLNPDAYQGHFAITHLEA